jgi:hypothetical protein
MSVIPKHQILVESKELFCPKIADLTNGMCIIKAKMK